MVKYCMKLFLYYSDTLLINFKVFCTFINYKINHVDYVSYFCAENSNVLMQVTEQGSLILDNTNCQYI